MLLSASVERFGVSCMQFFFIGVYKNLLVLTLCHEYFELNKYGGNFRILVLVTKMENFMYFYKHHFFYTFIRTCDKTIHINIYIFLGVESIKIWCFYLANKYFLKLFWLLPATFHNLRLR